MKEKILIVEDETDMANLLAYRLSRKGYNPILASNGRDALDIIEKEIPDLVLLDIMMEKIDGWAVCSSIRTSANETIKRLPIIMLTALSEDEEKIIGLRLGADDYITKPFNMNELILRVQNILRKKRTEDELMERLKKGNNIPALFYHEVKNQLVIIGTYSYLIAKESITQGKREKFSEILSSTVMGISEYLDGMSLFSKIENGERKIRLEKFSLRETINKIIHSYKKNASLRGIQIKNDYRIISSPLAPLSLSLGERVGVREVGEGYIVNLNSIAMKMILSNLIGNAIKYNKNEGSVSIDTLRDGDKLVITIEDSGLGIDPSDIPYIFDRFYRSRNVEGHIEGTGIGLYIVKTLVNAMGGEIRVKSTLGKGSRFTAHFNSAFIKEEI